MALPLVQVDVNIIVIFVIINILMATYNMIFCIYQLLGPFHYYHHKSDGLKGALNPLKGLKGK